jgi:predicted amidohydrolase YtcJ
MQPNRALIDAGVLVAGGSDWPVSETPDPWQGIHGLVTRADPLGRAPGTLWPEQAISLEEAIAVFTLNAATAMGLGAERVAHHRQVGGLRDLDRDPFTVPTDTLVETTVLETWFAGRRVYARA